LSASRPAALPPGKEPLVPIGQEAGWAAGFCEHGNEPSDSIKAGNFFTSRETRSRDEDCLDSIPAAVADDTEQNLDEG